MVDLNSPDNLTQVKTFINDGSLSGNNDLGTWHMALLSLASEIRVVNIQGEHAGGDIEDPTFKEMFNAVIEVIF